MTTDSAATVPMGSTERWQDRKRGLWLLALVMPLLPFVAVGLHAVTNHGAWLWLGPIVILGVVPVVDLTLGLDRSNPPEALIPALEADRYYRWLTYLFLPLQYAGLLTAAWVVARGNLTRLDTVGLTLTVGFIGGLGINTAHELGHKKESVERWLAKIALAPSGYGHFYTEHNRGHHVRVATPDDPASSRVGENFYQFWPRTVGGSVASAWRLERRRYARRGQHPFRLGNDIINAWLMTAVLWAALIAWLGVTILPFLLLQALVALSLLEAVNYLEHYGMLRERVGIGEHEHWERVAPSHSWNSNNMATNVLLYHLQRHSDHHANPTRRYQALRDYSESPTLPTGYAGMILLALVPPAWRRVMDPLVLQHFDGDITRANISPARRDRVLAAYASSNVNRAARPVETGSAIVRNEVDGQGPIRARCPLCAYTYDETRGDAREGFVPGTPWALVPDRWVCPDCGVRDKTDFVVTRCVAADVSRSAATP